MHFLADESRDFGKPLALFDLAVTGPPGERAFYDTGSNAVPACSSREIVLMRSFVKELRHLLPGN